jgi:hypothetical protein
VKRAVLQILALLPLPVVVIIVAHPGPRPEIVLPAGKRAAGGAEAPKAAATLPAELKPGWKLQAPPVRYDEKTLFDRIDGGAPAFLRAGFVYSLGADYRQEGAKDPVVVDVYDMGTTSCALGIYATERDLSYRFIPVGDAGYLAAGSLNFWSGRFYVKLAGYEQGEAMDKGLTSLAQGIVAALPKEKGAGKELAPLKLLPAEGRMPNSDGYSHAPLGDVDGLAVVYYAEYKEGDATYRLFVAREATAAAAAARFEKVRGYFLKDKAGVKEGTEGKLKALEVSGDGGTASFVLLGGELIGGSLDMPAAQVQAARAKLAGALSAGQVKQ